MELQKRWDNRLAFPFSDLGKLYLRQNFRILLDCSIDQGKLSIGKRFSLAIFMNGESGHDTRVGGNEKVRARSNDGQFSMFVESVHVMNDTEGVTFSIAPSVIWLHISNERENLWVGDSLYFSLVLAKFIFRKRLFAEHREFDGGSRLGSVLSTGKMPSDMVERRSQVVDNFAAQDAKTFGKLDAAMVIESLLPLLRVHFGHDWILASFEESVHFSVKVDDVLVGAF